MIDFKAVVQGIFSVGKTDTELAVLPLLAQAVTSIAANPIELNIVAQGNVLLAGLIAAGPKVELQVLQTIAAEINAATAAAVTSLSQKALSSPKA